MAALAAGGEVFLSAFGLGEGVGAVPDFAVGGGGGRRGLGTDRNRCKNGNKD